MKPVILMLLLAALIIPAEAGKKRGGNRAAAANKQAQKEEKEDQVKRKERDRAHKALGDLLAKKDTNKDKFLSKDEYVAGESNAETAGKRFDKFNKNEDRTLSKGEMEALLGF
jgi:hypothetical protein